MSYELKKDTGGKFRFNLKVGNGEIILTSESYSQKASALSGIDPVCANGASEGSYERKTSSSNKPFFVLKAQNGSIIGCSEMYSSAAARDNGIASVQKNCTSPTVKDLT